MANEQTTRRCMACGAPATREDADGIPLCDGDYQHLLEHWVREFVNSQEPLGREFEKVLSDNLWSLYVRS